jgi:toxin YoeB
VEKLKIVWSDVANEKLEEILFFYLVRNESETYSKKLFRKFMQDIRLLSHAPNIGITNKLKNVRGLIIEEFIVYYEIKEDTVLILTIWDCSQNPEINKFTILD